MVSTKSAGDSTYDGKEERTIELASKMSEDRVGSSRWHTVRKCVKSSGQFGIAYKKHLQLNGVLC